MVNAVVEVVVAHVASAKEDTVVVKIEAIRKAVWALVDSTLNSVVASVVVVAARLPQARRMGLVVMVAGAAMRTSLTHRRKSADGVVNRTLVTGELATAWSPSENLHLLYGVRAKIDLATCQCVS